MCAKVKRQTFKGKPLPLNQFYHKVPDTLLAYIFSFLTPRDLSIWRDAFERFFTNSPPIRLAESWKLEYLSRVESVRNLEFSRLYVTDIDSRLSQVDRMVVCQPNVITPDSLSVGHLESGACSLLEIKRGKFIKYVWFGSAQRQPTCLELASVGVLVGFLNGQVAFSLYSASTVNFLPMESSHTAPISALAFSTGSSEATPLLAASGSLDGLICIWDTARPRLLTKLKGVESQIIS
ncbi:hypothetical protein L0F63_001295 [Massospora cicadina]|nr:hypothetical protein L0F63_001295 [Massospora cicadina]